MISNLKLTTCGSPKLIGAEGTFGTERSSIGFGIEKCSKRVGMILEAPEEIGIKTVEDDGDDLKHGGVKKGCFFVEIILTVFK